MSTEVYGVFENRHSAQEAEKALISADFSRGEIEIRRVDEAQKAGLAGDAGNEEVFLIVTAPDPADQQRAHEILSQAGARFIGEEEDRYHVNRLILDPDYSEEVADTNPSVTGIL